MPGAAASDNPEDVSAGWLGICVPGRCCFGHHGREALRAIGIAWNCPRQQQTGGGCARVAGCARREAVAKATPVVLDQRNLSFTPRVLAVPVGTMVEFPNNDRVFHNVFSFRDGKRFDLGLYLVGSSRQVAFDKPGLSRIYCNIHPNMAAYVMAVDSPYFAVSDRAGTFRIAAVPTGTYRYYAWRLGAEQLTGTWSRPPMDP